MVEDKFEIKKRNNTTYYLKNNIFHRVDGPAIEDVNGDQEWYCEGKHHRIDGPAYISLEGRYKEWYIDGKLHREDGPAIIFTDETGEWWYKGKKIWCSSQAEFEKILKLLAFM